MNSNHPDQFGLASALHVVNGTVRAALVLIVVACVAFTVRSALSSARGRSLPWS
jgi:hypothetical protein